MPWRRLCLPGQAPPRPAGPPLAPAFLADSGPGRQRRRLTSPGGRAGAQPLPAQHPPPGIGAARRRFWLELAAHSGSPRRAALRRSAPSAARSHRCATPGCPLDLHPQPQIVHNLDKTFMFRIDCTRCANAGLQGPGGGLSGGRRGGSAGRRYAAAALHPGAFAAAAVRSRSLRKRVNRGN